MAVMALEFIANFTYDIIINHTDIEMYLRHRYIQPDSYYFHAKFRTCNTADYD